MFTTRTLFVVAFRDPKSQQDPPIDIDDVLNRFAARDYTPKPGVIAVIALTLRAGEALPDDIGADNVLTAIYAMMAKYDAGVRTCNCGEPSCEANAIFKAFARQDELEAQKVAA